MGVWWVIVALFRPSPVSRESGDARMHGKQDAIVNLQSMWPNGKQLSIIVSPCANVCAFLTFFFWRWCVLNWCSRSRAKKWFIHMSSEFVPRFVMDFVGAVPFELQGFWRNCHVYWVYSLALERFTIPLRRGGIRKTGLVKLICVLTCRGTCLPHLKFDGM